MHHLLADVWMLGVQDAIHHRIAHVEIRRVHVDLGPQRARAVRKLADLHATKEIEIFRNRTMAIRTFLAALEIAAILGDLLRRQIADISLAGLDELLGPLIKLLEIVRGVIQSIPLEAEPAHVFHDRIDVLDVFLDRIGIVEAQIALAAILGGETEVEANRFGMADVQIAVRLRRKSRVNAALERARLAMLVDDFLNEVAGRGRLFRRFLRVRLRLALLAFPRIRCGHDFPTSIGTQAPAHGKRIS